MNSLEVYVFTHFQYFELTKEVKLDILKLSQKHNFYAEKIERLLFRPPPEHKTFVWCCCYTKSGDFIAVCLLGHSDWTGFFKKYCLEILFLLVDEKHQKQRIGTTLVGGATGLYLDIIKGLKLFKKSKKTTELVVECDKKETSSFWIKNGFSIKLNIKDKAFLLSLNSSEYM